MIGQEAQHLKKDTTVSPFSWVFLGSPTYYKRGTREDCSWEAPTGQEDKVNKKRPSPWPRELKKGHQQRGTGEDHPAWQPKH